MGKEAEACGAESVEICSTCEHPRCQDCLWEMIARQRPSRSSRALESSAKSIGWLSEHDTFVRSSANADEDAKLIQQLLETEFPMLQGKTDEM